MGDTVVVQPAATVVVIREHRAEVEVLLLQRSSKLAFHGGAWVFPGGRVDPGDATAAGDEPRSLAAGRLAAVRELREESNLVAEPAALQPFSRWVTPEGLPRRFDTWFFAVPAPTGDVRVDGGEIHDHRWMTPAAALDAHCRGEIELPPPTFVTLWELRGCPDNAALWQSFAPPEVRQFIPNFHLVDGGGCSLYHGDAAYESGDLHRPGGRHRLWMIGTDWRYERSDA